MAHQCIFLNLREAAAIFQIYGTGTDDAGKRGAEVVGDCPQQVRPHLFFFCFHQHLFTFRRTRACVFMLLVMALVMPEIENIATKVIG